MLRRSIRRPWTIETNPEAFGQFYDSTPHLADLATLRLRLREDGYLLLRQRADIAGLVGVRQLVAEKLQQEEAVKYSRVEKSCAANSRYAGLYQTLNDLGDHPALRKIVRDTSLVRLFSGLFSTPAMAMDHVWARAVGMGRQSPVHCDWVYMCRGSRRILSAWMPLVDVPIARGPLMILERSHRDNVHTGEYLQLDADRLGLLDGLRWKHGQFIRGGKYSVCPDKVGKEFGARWLTGIVNVGDLVIFDPRCLHATLPNQTAEVRLSIDARFQPANDPIDARFFGPKPLVHSGRDKNVFEYLLRIKALLVQLAPLFTQPRPKADIN